MPAHLIVYLLGRERPTNDPFVPYIRSLSVCGVERGNDQLSRDTQRGGHPLCGRNKIVISSHAWIFFPTIHPHHHLRDVLLEFTRTVWGPLGGALVCDKTRLSRSQAPPRESRKRRRPASRECLRYANIPLNKHVRLM
jgi:hypothetical protein